MYGGRVSSVKASVLTAASVGCREREVVYIWLSQETLVLCVLSSGTSVFMFNICLLCVGTAK